MRALLAPVLLTWGGVVAAATVENLYITTVTVADRSEAARERAFVQALSDVAVRVSGQLDAPQRLGPAVGKAKRALQRFGYLSQNQLQVGFDPRAVDEMLANAGLPIWGHERPETIVWLQTDDGAGGKRQVTDATPDPERDAIVRAAQLRGIPLRWISQISGLESLLALHPGPTELDAERQRLGADALLIGYATRSGIGNEPTVRWQLVFDGTVQAVAGAPESGIHLAADTFAKLLAAPSGTLVDVAVEVSGIADLDAYAQTLNYLEGLTLVRRVSVNEVRGDVVEFRVVSRGDVATLRRALTLEHRLAPQSLEGSAPDPQRLRLHFQAAR